MQTDNRLDFAWHTSGGFTLEGAELRLASAGAAVTIDQQRHRFEFAAAGKTPLQLGAWQGAVERYEATGAGLVVGLEAFLSDDRQRVALRVTLRNVQQKPCRLGAVELAKVEQQADFIVGGAAIDEWRVLRYPFQKSDIPSCYSPTKVDKDFTDSVYSCAKAIPGQGVIYNLLNIEQRTVSSGPIMMVKNASRSVTPILMIATTDIRHHDIYQELTTSEDRTAFKRFTITNDFLGMELAPGAEIASHWLLFTLGSHESDLLDLYADTVGLLQQVPLPRKPSPTVFCTWYFYTFMISEKYVLEELEAIARRRVPLDVFQIDDGWMDSYGTYEPHPEKFPRGMAFLAEKIAAAGMTPGIWAAPFVIDAKSPIVDRYPEMFQLDEKGDRVIYLTDRDCYLLDPTAPGAADYLRDTMEKFMRWGYRYFKLDWLRAICAVPNVVFYDRRINSYHAFYLAMEMIREVVGPDLFILACGGLSDPGALNLVDGTRTSKDVRGTWNGPDEVPKSGAVVQIKQNLLRNYSNRFYHTDPDATQIRIRKERFSEKETKCVGVYQSEGHYSDEEARTICTHQYLCGGLVTISERFPELQEERLALLRHISPAATPPARILDYDAPGCPTLFLTTIDPVCRELGRYHTLTIGNWEDEEVTRRFTLQELPTGATWSERLALFEFHTQTFIGCISPEETIEITLPPHAVRVLRIAPVVDQTPMIIGTDLHLSGGGVEIASLNIESNRISGCIKTDWHYPVKVTAAFPDASGWLHLQQTTTAVGGGDFTISAE